MKRLKAFWQLFPRLHLWLAAVLGLLLLFRQARGNRQLMNLLVERVTSPWKEGVARLCALVPFSVAEVVVCLAAVAALALLAWLVRGMVRARGFFRPPWGRAKALYRLLLVAACTGLSVYAGFCLLWGCNYYADSFQQRSGIQAQPVTVEQLKRTTAYFARMASQTAPQVNRDSQGLYDEPEEEIFAQSKVIYHNLEDQFPFLRRDATVVKPVFFSQLMSYTDFTGVYFPFTGESNVNTHCPQVMLPSTIAHEIAHQRNVAMEQEANFVAVLACASSGSPAYAYSGYLLGYIHLSNALYQADRESWQQISSSLSPLVQQDLAVHNAYWQRYSTPVKKVTTGIYEGFLKSYDQELGMRSYGAVVDLLVTYFGDRTA